MATGPPGFTTERLEESTRCGNLIDGPIALLNLTFVPLLVRCGWNPLVDPVE